MQQALDYRTNRNLFSNYYLDEHLPESAAWDGTDSGEVEATCEDIEAIFERERPYVEGYNEAELEEDLIKPVLRALDVPYGVQATVAGSGRRPDYAFFESDDARQAALDHRKEGGDFYRDAIAVADAKRWGRPLDTRGSSKYDFENPSYQIHVYLQETPTDWAVLTDGRRWRLYYGPTSHRLDSYYEIDLVGLFETGDREAFKYFYYFFRREAFSEDASGDCFLDEVLEESNVFAQELGEDLQDNIYEAITVLSEGFLTYSDNNLDAGDLDLIHDCSLVYLYRLIFVFYAESEGRELLPTENEIYADSYSLNDLKGHVAAQLDGPSSKYRDWRTDLADRLDELFELIDRGSDAMGIPKEDLFVPAYNGGLFRTQPEEGNGESSREARFLRENEVGDAHLARVIDLLARSRTGNAGNEKAFVDYSSLDERHLGSIYEGLLEYRLHVADEPLAIAEGEYVPVAEDGNGESDGDPDIEVEAGEVYLTTDSGERKATGSYYTPEYVVEYIVENTLGPLVREIREDLLAGDPFDESGEGGGFAAEFAERVFDLKVLDPAMGSGHFLVNAIDYLAREIIDAQERQAAQQGIESVAEERDINWARRQVAQKCIYGVDVNPLATELAKVSLWLRTLAAKQPLAFLDHHLKTGNSLVGSDIEEIDALEAEVGNDGPNATLADFGAVRRGTIDHLMDVYQEFIAIENRELADAKEMERRYQEIERDELRNRLVGIANVHTAEDFGLEVPGDAYERLARGLSDDEEWKEVSGSEWFRSAQETAEEREVFHWKLEFPEVFYEVDGTGQENPGFDAVIGNPPYVKIQNLVKTAPDVSEYARKIYTTATERFDLYALFVQAGVSISKEGRVCYILPNKFFESNAGEGLRTFLTKNRLITQILDFGQYQVFSGATTYTCILSLSTGSDEFEYGTLRAKPQMARDLTELDYATISTNELDTSSWALSGPEERRVLEKIRSGGQPLDEVSEYLSEGVVTGDNQVFLVKIDSKEDTMMSVKCLVDNSTYEIEEEMVHMCAGGDDISRYNPLSTDTGLIYPYETRNGRSVTIEEPRMKEKYPNTYDYLSEFRDRLENRGSKSMDYPEWYSLWRPREKRLFESEKLVSPDIGSDCEFAHDPAGDVYLPNSAYGIVPRENTEIVREYLLAVLNSSVSWFFIYHTSPVLRGDFRRFMTSYLSRLPVPRGLEHVDKAEQNDQYVRAIQEYQRGDELPAVESLQKLLAHCGESMIEAHSQDSSLNLNLLDYLGTYGDGQALADLYQPPAGLADSMLTATAAEYEKLRLGRVAVEDSGAKLLVRATARYKPKNPDEYETDRWDYTETEFEPVMEFVGLSDAERALISEFVPYAADEAGGFAGFRENATKTKSILDRLEALTLPAIDDVEGGLERYLRTKERAEELDEKIEKTDELIDQIVYRLYGLTEEEIEIVEESVGR